MRSRPFLCWVLALALTGCAAEERERSGRERPPAPIVVTAAVIDGGVHVSPHAFGAGPIRLIVTNQTSRAHAITLETEDAREGPGVTRSTRPIAPRDTATLTVDVREGAYLLHTASRRIDPARLSVGAPRPSAQSDLLLP